MVPLNALVVFYTDGFTERTHDISQGEKELVEAVHLMNAHASPQAARTIAEHIFRDKPHHDDAALMVLCTRPNRQVVKEDCGG
jgi:serine phosphatase RsbU (regulator of sigma subunit)